MACQEGLESLASDRMPERRQSAVRTLNEDPQHAVAISITAAGKMSSPRNMLSMGTLAVTMEYKINGRHGGSSNPSEPAPVISPESVPLFIAAR